MTWIATNTAWIGVVGALGGVVLTSVIGFITAILNHRWQDASSRDDRSYKWRESKSSLRREAYARFLVAAQILGDEFGTFEPAAGGPSDPEARMLALRARDPGKFVEFDGSERHARLLAGDEVVRALDEHSNWFVGQCLMALSSDEPTSLEAFNDWTQIEGQLINAMKREEATDFPSG